MDAEPLARIKAKGRLPANSGVTLTELMITVVIISVAALGLTKTFSGISKAIQTHRARTLAINLSQEQVESLKDKSYFSIIPTSTPTYHTSLSPALAYDAVYYPPQSISIGQNKFQRLTYVERMFNSGGNLVSVPYDSLDTGLKRITVHTVWQLDGRWYKSTLTNLVANYSQASNGGFSGTVTGPGGSAVADANVYLQQDAFFHDYSDSSGNYAFAATPGTYGIAVMAPGYHRAASTTTYNITAGSILQVNFTLTPISSGSVSGFVYVNNHAVISQVVGGTNTVCGDSLNHDVEYVELFNPTTHAIDVSQTGPLNQNLKINYYDENAGFNKTDGQFNFTYVSTYIAPGQYYLMANATYFYVTGGWKTADAYYGTLYANYIRRDKAGAIELQNAVDSSIIDVVGWNDNNTAAPKKEGTALDLSSSDGLALGSQIVRLSSPTSTLSDTYGKAYDSGSNSSDFQYLTMAYQPRTTAQAAQTVISGTPADGAVVTANDGLSASTMAWRISIGGFSYATFTLVGIATGTWTVDITSGSSTISITSAAVLTQGVNTAVPNSATSPSWTIAGSNSSVLTTDTSNGIVSGRVTNPSGTGLSGISVTVEPAASGNTDPQGYYSIPVPAGTYSVIANPNSNSSPSYGSASLSAVTVDVGQLSAGNDLVLSGAGRLSGYVCNYSATNPYPGITVMATDLYDNVRGQAVSGSDGKFLISNLSTGTYTITTTLETGQSASPTSLSGSVTAGSNVWAGTFTITGAYGVITGSATKSGSPITTGVLVIATTGTISGSLPPAISTATLSGAPYYMASTSSEGNFTLNVRASTASATFNLYGWYTTFSNETPNTPDKKSKTVAVTGGQTTSTGLQW